MLGLNFPIVSKKLFLSKKSIPIPKVLITCPVRGLFIKGVGHVS
jgi:hypothetical protein